MRYEDDFGSFWMVDDNEFVKRRHLSRGRPRKYASPSPPGGEQSNATNHSSNSSQAPNTQAEQTGTANEYSSPANSTTSSMNFGNEGEHLAQGSGINAGIQQ